MKKLICLLTAILLSLDFFAQTLEKPIPVQASFGRYGSDCSSGRGTCSFSVSKSNPEKLNGKDCKKLSENSFVLRIERNILTKNEEVCIAGTVFSELNPGETTFFVQQDDITLETDTLRNICIDPKFNKIAAGNYPLSISKDKVEIIFTLKDPNDVKH